MKFFQNHETVEWRELIVTYSHHFAEYNTHTMHCKIRGMEDLWFKDNRNGDWGLEFRSKCDFTWLTGNHTTYFNKYQQVLNLKHVPKSIKNAEYETFGEWLSAVWEHIAKARAKALFKATVKENNRRAEMAVEFMNFKGEMEPVVDAYGFKPTTDVPECCKKQNLLTWNDVWAHHPDKGWRKDSVQFTNGKMTVTADVQRSRQNKVTIQGIPANKIREVLATICEMVK